MFMGIQILNSVRTWKEWIRIQANFQKFFFPFRYFFCLQKNDLPFNVKLRRVVFIFYLFFFNGGLKSLDPKHCYFVNSLLNIICPSLLKYINEFRQVWTLLLKLLWNCGVNITGIGSPVPTYETRDHGYFTNPYLKHFLKIWCWDFLKAFIYQSI